MNENRKPLGNSVPCLWWQYRLKPEFQYQPEDKFFSLDPVLPPKLATGIYEMNMKMEIRNIKTGEIKTLENYSRNNRGSHKISLSSGPKKNRFKRAYAIYWLGSKLFLNTILGNDDVDHIDRDPLNTSLSNLRNCSKKFNMSNRNPQRRDRFAFVIYSKLDHNYDFPLTLINYEDLTTKEVAYISDNMAKSGHYKGFKWKKIDLDAFNYCENFGYPNENEWRYCIIDDSVEFNSNGCKRIKEFITLGYEDVYGYRTSTINRVSRRDSRWIYETFTGDLLKESDIIDHINGNCKDNRSCNLRKTTPLGNMLNPNTLQKHKRTKEEENIINMNRYFKRKSKIVYLNELNNINNIKLLIIGKNERAL